MSVSPDADCRLCGLCEGRTTIVLPDGDLTSRVVFVGEAPGENEDLQGRPFVGKSGKILENAMDAAGISRSDVMITNTVKCRLANMRAVRFRNSPAALVFFSRRDRQHFVPLRSKKVQKNQ